jgi:peptidoglycan/LPS O-acetylase OafA/YrhL
MSEFSPRRLAGLDLVRTVAILSVVAGHYWPIYERFPALKPFKFLGVLGVELFFVLSGFLIGGILLRQAADLDGAAGGFGLRHAPGFWLRRWFRTLPNYALFFVLFLLMDRPWQNDTWRAWALSVFFLQNLVSDESSGTFGVAWSLCVEEWLYLLLPLALAAFTVRQKNSAQAALSSTLLLIVAPTLLRCTTVGREWDLGVRHIVIYRLDAIAYGVLLAYLARYRRGLFAHLAGARSALTGAACLIASSMFWWAIGERWIATDTARSGIRWFVMSVLFFPALSIAIVPIVGWASRLGELPVGCRTLVYRTSLYSYSMYLAHTLVFFFAGSALYRAVVALFGEFRGLTFVMVALNLVVLYGFSALIHHVWEAPMTRLRERFAPVRPATVTS